MGGKGSGGLRKNALPREKSPVVQAHDPTNIDPDVNRRAIAMGQEMIWWDAPSFKDPEEMIQRFNDYIELCAKYEVRPLVTGMAMALGMNRHAFTGIATGNPQYQNYKGITSECKAVTQKAYEYLSILYESQLSEEKGNPTKWIFLGKNHFGYRDQTERVNFHVDEKAALPSADQVAAKYAHMLGKDEDPLELEVIEPEQLPEAEK